MLAVGRSCRFGLALFGLVLALASAAAQEPTVVRLIDAVGDTIDAAERDSFRLFPNTTCFQHAVILSLPGPEYYADATLADGDTLRQVYFRILPTQLERIRFLVDKRDYMTEQLQSDPNAALALASFWKAIEDYPLQSIEGEPASYPAASQPQLPLVTNEKRYYWTLHGATCGSVAGGCIGSYTGYTLLEPGHIEQTECGDIYIPALYRVNITALYATTLGATALGALAGYTFGDAEDRKPAPASLAREHTEWRNGCAGASALPALALGFLAAAAAQGTLYGREQSGYNLENDPSGLSVIPAVLTGLCVSVEIVTLAYHIGRSIDRENAEKAAAKRQALGR